MSKSREALKHMKMIYSRPNQLFTSCRKVKLSGKEVTHFCSSLYKFDSSTYDRY